MLDKLADNPLHGASPEAIPTPEEQPNPDTFPDPAHDPHTNPPQDPVPPQPGGKTSAVHGYAFSAG